MTATEPDHETWLERISTPAVPSGIYGTVIHEHFIQVGLVGLGVWMFIGNLVIRKMIDMRI